MYAKHLYECGLYDDAAEWLNVFLTLFRQEHLDKLYMYAKHLYECGLYDDAAEWLNVFLTLNPLTSKDDLSSLWGKLAAEILTKNWEFAMEDLRSLKKAIDNKYINMTQHSIRLKARLIHWSLFVFFNHPEGRDNIINNFLYQPEYLNIIQTTCPHILRYLTAAVIFIKDARKCGRVLKDLIKVIKQVSYSYKDPITEFVEYLHGSFDLSTAKKKLKECEPVLVNDFFLEGCFDKFMAYAYFLIHETFQHHHERIINRTRKEQQNEYRREVLIQGQKQNRMEKSTTTALMSFRDTVNNQRNNGTFVSATFLDLSKALGTAAHEKLINVLSDLNPSEHTIAWYQSYLSGRQQAFQWQKDPSPLLPVTLGTPQGSILGPYFVCFY
ncbi:eukaryotic translation initiation factor 3 subunit E-like [Protopterus annectens]|uniref:eukaryotic translation initiation factor 3 subunit E-like n=1 Tax=Protopterus annectens TaxID=7888 RepID=UPI001CFAB5D1|nr:eukaryotic translation initiation factor 3 subunit E-like [Protopterus annectens]